MGVEYSLNDPAKGECFAFGKGWRGAEGSTDYDPAPAANPPLEPGWVRCGTVGYRWAALASRDETLHYVRTHFHWLVSEPHSDDCPFIGQTRAGEDCKGRWCSFNEPDDEDLGYANWLADVLWTWLQGRDQSQLDVNHDSGDDVHCHGEPEWHEKYCHYLAPKYERHFYVTGSRYKEDQHRLAKLPTKSKETP